MTLVHDRDRVGFVQVVGVGPGQGPPVLTLTLAGEKCSRSPRPPWVLTRTWESELPQAAIATVERTTSLPTQAGTLRIFPTPSE